MNTTQRDAIGSPATGLVIFNTDCSDIQFYSGAGWVPMSNSGMLATPGSISGNSTPCPNSSGLTYSIEAIANATGYHWTVPQGTTILSGQGTTSIMVAFGAASGVICVAAYNDCYRSSLSCLDIELTPELPVSVSIAASANPVCSGTSVTFTATPTNGGPAPLYQWKIGGNNVEGATNPTYAYAPANNDAVTCMLTSNALCAAGNPAISNTVTMTVNPILPVSISIVSSANPALAGTSVTFTATPVNGGDTPNYQWKVNGANVGTNSPTYSYVPANSDSVKCLLTSNQACITGSPATSNVIVMTITGLPCPGTPTVTYGGKTYNTVKIGTQCWFKNNLNIGALINGSQEQTNNSTIEKYCYNDLESNCDVYGGLYQWNEMMQYVTTSGAQGICPAGWHMPTYSDWYTMTAFLGGESVAGGKMKETGSTHWQFPNIGATNESGFTAVPAGFRYYDGTFNQIAGYGWFWSSTRDFSTNYFGWRVFSYSSYLDFPGTGDTFGISVRCLRDTCSNYSSTGVSITPSVNPVCAGSSVTFTAIPTNGGTSPFYQWKVNETFVGTNSPTYQYNPANSDAVMCIMTSSTPCASNPASSNVVTMTVNTVPATPTAGTHAPSLTQIIWNWNSVANASGYKWNTENNYSTATDLGTATTKTETGLTCNTACTRYVWAYNTCGNSTPATLNQTTSACSTSGVPCPGTPTVTYGGKTYNTVLIGTQCWFKENLNIGTQINGSQEQTNNSIIEKYCFANYEDYCDLFGGLYQWNEIMQYQTTAGVQGICPAGWHIPTDGEWTILTAFLGGETVAGGKMKSIGNSQDGTGLWQWPNEEATNESGYTGMPAGVRGNNDGSFAGEGQSIDLWSSTEYNGDRAMCRGLTYYSSGLSILGNDKLDGFSVRCIRNY